MRYRHQAVNLKEPLTQDEIAHHTKILRVEFTFHQSTGYWQPEGQDWKKEVSRGRYYVHPVDGQFGLMVSFHETKNAGYKLFTVYPKLQLAVLDKWLTIGYRNHNRDVWATKKLEKLGYKVAKEKSCGDDYLGKKRAAFTIAAEESRCFRTQGVLEQVVNLLNTIVQNRPMSSHCEVAVFSPAADGMVNSPIGRGKDDFNWYDVPIQSNITSNYLIPIANGGVDIGYLEKIFSEMTASETLGISSHLPHLINEGNQATPSCFGSNHIPMIDFKCATPEEAIHTIEKLGRKITRQDVVLIDSGKSFHAHFPTDSLIPEDAEKFLESLKLQETACEKWIPVQQERRYQFLRVSPSIRKPRLPAILGL